MTPDTVTVALPGRRVAVFDSEIPPWDRRRLTLAWRGIWRAIPRRWRRRIVRAWAGRRDVLHVVNLADPDAFGHAADLWRRIGLEYPPAGYCDLASGRVTLHYRPGRYAAKLCHRTVESPPPAPPGSESIEPPADTDAQEAPPPGWEDDRVIAHELGHAALHAGRPDAMARHWQEAASGVALDKQAIEREADALAAKWLRRAVRRWRRRREVTRH